MNSRPKILFVYNADASLASAALDFAHKIISPKTYPCSLCMISYSNFGMKKDWRHFIDSLGVDVEFLHRDEFQKAYPNLQANLPAAFKMTDGKLSELISAKEMNSLSSLDDLKKIVRSKVKTQSKRMIYALTGGNGSGKTTFALKVSKEHSATFFSLDKTIKGFNEPIDSYETYMRHFQRALDSMASRAIEVLNAGGSVVFDFGGGASTRPWLKQIAKATGAQIEIFHLEVPLEIRRQRIRQRNKDKAKDVYFFEMSDEEFDRHNKSESEAPPAEEGITVIKVNNS